MSRHVVVTTNKRGVFAGTLESAGPETVVLTAAQMCIYWSAETRGVLGLAATGPAEGSRVGPAVPRLELSGVTAVVDMTDTAIERWREMPWT